MALVDSIEFYGHAVAAGDMTHEDAVTALVMASKGGITERGAASLIADWSKQVRERVRAGVPRQSRH